MLVTGGPRKLPWGWEMEGIPARINREELMAGAKAAGWDMEVEKGPGKTYTREHRVYRRVRVRCTEDPQTIL